MTHYFTRYLKYYLKYHNLVGGELDLVDFLNNYPLDYFKSADILHLLQTTRLSESNLSSSVQKKIQTIMDREISQLTPQLELIRDDNSWGLEMRGQQAEHAYEVYNQAEIYLGDLLDISKPFTEPFLKSILTRCQLLKKIEYFVENPYSVVDEIDEQDETSINDFGSDSD